MFISPIKPNLTAWAIRKFYRETMSKQRDIEIILREMAEQVAIRLRRARKKTTVVSIHLGFSKQEQKTLHTYPDEGGADQ